MFGMRGRGIEIPDSVSSRKRYIVFSTKNPASVQRIPWPSDDSDQDDGASVYKRQIGNESWLVNDDEFPWLVESDGGHLFDRNVCFLTLAVVSVVAIQHWRAVGIDTWITSDGRAYFVQLHESQGHDSLSEVNEPEYMHVCLVIQHCNNILITHRTQKTSHQLVIHHSHIFGKGRVFMISRPRYGCKNDVFLKREIIFSIHTMNQDVPWSLLSITNFQSSQ